MTASVSFCCRECVGGRHRRSPPRSTDPRQRVAHQLVHHPLAAEARLHQHHPGRLGPHLADLRRALAAGNGAQRGQRRVRSLFGRRRRRACPRWPRTSGRSQGSRTRPPRPGRPARPPRARASPPARRAPARSSTEATPPRVASRMQRSAGPASSSSASATGHSERVSDSIAASSSNSPRASMIAVPCSPIVPDSRMRSPGRIASAARRRARIALPDAGRADVHLVGGAALDDLGVAGDDLHAGAACGRGDRLHLGPQVVRREALLEDQRQA